MKTLFALLTTITCSFFVNGQCVLNYSADSIPANCAGSCDGGLVFTFSNSGTPAAPYVATFKNSAGTTIGTHTFFGESGSTTFSGVCAGNYSVSMQSIPTPSCNCSASITVTEPSPVVISSVNVVHETSGLSNGAIDINASGGVSPYHYSIDNGSSFQLSDVFTGLDAGNYLIAVEDDSGCVAYDLVSVGEMISSGCEVVATADPQSTSCAGICDGQINYSYENLQPGFPGAPYTVTLQDSDGNLLDTQVHPSENNTMLFDNLCAGAYTILVQGGTCSFQLTTLVMAPDPIVLYVNSTQPTFGLNNGQAELVEVGGVSPYSFSINGGTTYQSSPLFSGLAEGTYQAVVEDANGCQNDVDILLTDPTTCGLTLTANVLSEPACFGSCDGVVSYSFTDLSSHLHYTISLIHNGIVQPINSHNTAPDTGTLDGICAGNYTLQITDALGCSAVIPLIMPQPPFLQVDHVNTTNCDPGMNNGTATIIASGGQPAYSYSLDAITYVSSNSFTGLSNGLHVAYVKDANGCIAELPFIVQKNASCNFNVTAIPDTTSCTGTCDGSISYQFSGSGSDTPFSITLTHNGDILETAVNVNTTVTGSFNGLCPGTYLITVGNSSGCEQLAVAVIPEPFTLDVTASAQTASIGNTDGAVLIYANGGTPPYEYSINGQVSWQSASVFSGVGAGSYTAWVRDSKGCLGICSVSVSDTSSCSFIIDLTSTNTSCVTNCDGEISCTFNDTDVNPIYQIMLFQGNTLIDTSGTYAGFSGLYIFSDLCAGAYRVSVIDNDGCTDAQDVFIHGPELLEVTGVNVVDASPGNADGSAEILVTGGTAPYSYTITDGTTWQAENTFNDLDSGFYVLMVKDVNDCIFIHCFVVNEQPGCTIPITFNLTQSISCYDSCDAIIEYGYFEALSSPPYLVELIFNSGVLDYEYYSSNTFNGIWDSLCPGTYSVAVTNANGCRAYMPTITVTKPADMILSGIVTDASTGMSDGSVQLTTSGGTGQHLYSLDNLNYQETASFENFPPGQYMAYVIDEKSCKDTMSFEISENTACNLSVNALSGGTLSCTGDCNGSLSFNYSDANTNPPYAVVLSNATGAIIASSLSTASAGSGLFTGLCAGTYQVAVSDGNGCESTPDQVVIAQPDYLDAGITVVHPTDGYFNGSITLNPSGGTPPYEYSTNNQITWSTTHSWTNLSVGFYVIYVKDANGCVHVICIVLHDQNASHVDELSNSLSLYPNPTYGLLYINSSDLQEIRVFDLSGKQVEIPVSMTSASTSLNLDGMATGLYFIELTLRNGNVMRKQIIKN